MRRLYVALRSGMEENKKLCAEEFEEYLKTGNSSYRAMPVGYACNNIVPCQKGEKQGKNGKDIGA